MDVDEASSRSGVGTMDDGVGVCFRGAPIAVEDSAQRRGLAGGEAKEFVDFGAVRRHVRDVYGMALAGLSSRHLSGRTVGGLR